MENTEQPDLKGAVLSRASLAGITFSRVAAAAPAFGGQVFTGTDSRGSAAAASPCRGYARAQGSAPSRHAVRPELAWVRLGRS